jgi:hypothetical protein
MTHTWQYSHTHLILLRDGPDMQRVRNGVFGPQFMATKQRETMGTVIFIDCIYLFAPFISKFGAKDQNYPYIIRHL